MIANMIMIFLLTTASVCSLTGGRFRSAYYAARQRLKTSIFPALFLSTAKLKRMPPSLGYYLAALLFCGMATSSCQRSVSLPRHDPAYSIVSLLPAGRAQAEPLAPGRIMSLYGQYLGPETGCIGYYDPYRVETANPARPQQSEPEKRIYTTQLCKTEITVGGIRAGLLFVQARQINFKVPQEVATSGTVPVQVTYDGKLGPLLQAPVNAGTP